MRKQARNGWEGENFTFLGKKWLVEMINSFLSKKLYVLTVFSLIIVMCHTYLVEKLYKMSLFER